MAKVILLIALAVNLGGCAVTAVVGAAASVVGAAADVAGSAVSATVDVVGAGVSGAINLATSDDDDKEADDKKAQLAEDTGGEGVDAKDAEAKD